MCTVGQFVFILAQVVLVLVGVAMALQHYTGDCGLTDRYTGWVLLKLTKQEKAHTMPLQTSSVHNGPMLLYSMSAVLFLLLASSFYSLLYVGYLGAYLKEVK